jgi:predicted ATPase
VTQALADRRLLLVLDTCEHVIAAAAAMAEAVLEAGSVPHIIATSRSERGVNGSIRHNRSPYRRWISGLTTILCVMVPCGCS